MFLKNRLQNMLEKLFPDPFVQNQNLAYIWTKNLKFHTVGVFLYAKLKAIEIYWN